MNVIQIQPYIERRELELFRERLIHANPFWFMQMAAVEATADWMKHMNALALSRDDKRPRV